MNVSLLLPLLLLQAAPPRPAATPPARAAVAPDPDEYRLGPEDVLALFVWHNAELTRTVQVRPDGRISLPLVNDVLVSGLTADAAPSDPRRSLPGVRQGHRAVGHRPGGQQLQGHDPRQGGQAGRHRLRAPTTVLELLGEAGGLAEYADGDNIVILRPEPRPAGQGSGAFYRRLRFNYKRVTQVGGETENIPLLPNDIVVVP